MTPILHFPADPRWHGAGIVVTVPACRPVDGRRVRDDDERNCHGDVAAVNCKRCLRVPSVRAALQTRNKDGG